MLRCQDEEKEAALPGRIVRGAAILKVILLSY